MLSKIRILQLFVSLVAIAIVSCGSELKYDDVVKAELARTERFDSIAHGIHLGMTFDDFKWICLLQNREGIFKPNATGNAVQLIFKTNFGYPVQFEFFPANIEGQYDTIEKYDATIKYRDYSIFNKEMSMEKLVQETIDYFEEGYGGRNFIRIPKEDDPWVKYKYVKIDGNRQITLIPIYMGNELPIEFKDLKPTKHTTIH